MVRDLEPVMPPSSPFVGLARRWTISSSSARVRSAPSMSALLTTNTSPISKMPAFSVCTSSPEPGWTSTATVSAVRTTSTSFWPAPTVSMMTTSFPKASSAFTASAVAIESPPSWPRALIDRKNTSMSPTFDAIRIRSPSTAPPVYGEEGSTATTPTVSPRSR